MEPFARIMILIAVYASRIQQAMGNSKRASELLVQLKLKIHSPDYELFMLRIGCKDVVYPIQMKYP